jgi:hypothetical protein
MNVPGANLVFLPGGLSVPDDIVQSGIVNPAQLQTWLAMNFDFPFVVASGSGAVLVRDEGHGSASQIYSSAATFAQALGSPNDDAWKRVAAEIAAAKQSLGPPEAQTLACSPDDWPLPSAQGYWTTFDSTQTSSSSSTTTTSVPVPVVDGRFWMVRSLALPAAIAQPPPAPRRFFRRQVAASPAEFTVAPHTVSPNIVESEAEVRPASAASSLEPTAIARTTSVGSEPVAQLEVARWSAAVNVGLLPSRLDAHALFSDAGAVDQVTTSSSTSIVIHLEHQLVTVGRYRAGQPWWNSVFLTDPGWYVPGMLRGALLPAPSDAEGQPANGLPIAMVVVRNFRVSGQWSQAASAALGSPGGTVGPLSLFGATAKTEADGVTVTFEHDGMQVVALLCSPLPVLPPVDMTAAIAASSSDASSSSSVSMSSSATSSQSSSSQSSSSSSASSQSSSSSSAPSQSSSSSSASSQSASSPSSSSPSSSSSSSSSA